MPNPENIEPYKMKPGQTLNPNGRPKKIYTVLKESGYSKDDMREAFHEIGWLTEDDAKAIIDDPTKPLLVKTLAQAFIKGAMKGDYRYIAEIIQQVIGKPKESLEITKKVYKITMNIDARSTGDNIQ